LIHLTGSTKAKQARDWLKKNVKSLVLFWVIAFGVLSLAVLRKGMGYVAKADEVSSALMVEGHPCFGYNVTGKLTCSFNPLLYPFTYISGHETNSIHFAGISDPNDYAGDSVKERRELSMVSPEFLKNLPYYLAISFIVAVGLTKLTGPLSRRLESQEA